MTFDKSKVCVAGLHDVPVGTKGYYSDELQQLETCVLTEYEPMIGECVGFNCNISKYEIIAPRWCWQFFYPCEEQVKQYRPYATIEEAERAFGKVVRHKDESGYMLITCIRKSRAYAGNIEINNTLSVVALFEQYTFEDGTPVGVEV